MTAFTKTLTDTNIPVEGFGSGIRTDGVQNYIALGTLGSFGSSMNSGVYISFDIQTTQTATGEIGTLNSGATGLTIGINENESGVNSPGKILAFIREQAGTKKVQCATTSATSVNDGNKHNVEITITPSTNTVVIKVDGVSQPITYLTQTTPATFSNFVNTFTIGARNNGGSIGLFLAAVFDNFKIGNSSASLRAANNYNDAVSPSADQSGNSNTASVAGSPAAVFSLGLDPINKETAKINSDNVSLTESLTYNNVILKTLTDTLSLAETLIKGFPAKVFSDLVSLFEASDYSLFTDGSQNYMHLGKLGNLGQNLGVGFYISFDIITTQTAIGEIGTLNTGKTAITIGINENESLANVSGKISVFMRDENNLVLRGATAAATSVNDGNRHTVEITVSPTTNVITVVVDGVSKAFTYNGQASPSTFTNFLNNFTVGARNNGGSIGLFLGATFDNVKVGTSSGALYSSVNFNDAANPTADLSGNGNVGTLAGSPLPTFSGGGSSANFSKLIGKFPDEVVSLTEEFDHIRARLLSDMVTLSEYTVSKVITKDIFNVLAAVRFSLLKEDGFRLLQENGDKIYIEDSSANLGETFVKSNSRSVVESISLTEFFQRAVIAARTFIENISLNETMSKQRSLFFSEQLSTLAEVFGKTFRLFWYRSNKNKRSWYSKNPVE